MSLGTSNVIALAAPPVSVEAVRLLAGHSGAEVTLREQDGISIVRKRAAAPAANTRLLQQATKQRLLRVMGLALPRVIETARDGSGRAYFDMEYVPACTLAATIATAGAYDAEAVIATIERMFALFRHNTGAAIPATVFARKIDEVVAKCAAHVHANAYLRDIAAVALALQMRAWSDIPSTPSHGDLTLENILISPAQGVVLIDCDEPFASSYWLDAGKLFQDIDGYWCLRAQLRGGRCEPTTLSAIQRMERLGGALRERLGHNDPMLPARLPQLAALALLRTLPYTQDTATVLFVLMRMRRLLGLGG